MSGYVYILSNESLPGLIKIGITSRDPFARATELRTTGVPTPFIVVAALLVPDPAGTESQLHRELDADRVDQGREFFKSSVQSAVRLLLAHVKELKPDTGERRSAFLNDIDPIQQALAHLQPGKAFNPPLAEQLLTASAKRGSALAHYHLGRLICENQDVFNKPVLARRATKHFEQAAAADLPLAFYGLAWLGKPEYVSAYLSRETDPVQMKEKSIDLFIRALWPGNSLPEVYFTSHFMALVPDIYTTLTERKRTEPKHWSARSLFHVRFLIYAIRASKAGLISFTPSRDELRSVEAEPKGVFSWRCNTPDPEGRLRWE